MNRRLASGTWLLGMVLLAGLSHLGSCAHPMPPGGGPIDETPPWLLSAAPESASTKHGPIDELRFEFSEKMDRQRASRWLQIYPRQIFRSTSWKAALTATVKLETPLPADTVVVIELLPGMKDSHGVPQPQGRMWAFATGDSLYDGEIHGHLILEDKPLDGAVVELLPAGPDTVRLEQRPLLRRTVTDSLGAYRLKWLPADGARWLLRTYDDRNKNRRHDDNEAIRLWPDTLSLRPEQAQLDLGTRPLYRPDTPGTLEGRLADRPVIAGTIFTFTQKIAENDTGFVAAPQPPRTSAGQAVPDTGSFTLEKVGPGLVRAIFFVDVDGDSLLSAVPMPPDSLLFLEPWALVDSLKIEPGLSATMPAPVWPDTLTPWIAPPPDTTEAAIADTLETAALDTLEAAAHDTLPSLETAPQDTLPAPPEEF